MTCVPLAITKRLGLGRRLFLLVALLCGLSSTHPFEAVCRADEIAPSLVGQPLVDHLRSHYRPTVRLNYKAARRKMFGEIDNRDGKVRCVYTGFVVETDGIPDDEVMNTEHTWPQSLFRERLPMKADLHHLFPTLKQPNGVRDNHPFADISDDDTEQWWISRSGHSAIPATSVRDDYSESAGKEFEPREDHKGNVARAMFYVWTVYGDKGITPDFIQSQLSTLARWHGDDPVNEDERARSIAVKAYQGNENPFVTDETLITRVLQTSPSPLAASSSPPITATVTISASTAPLAVAEASGKAVEARSVVQAGSNGEFADTHRFPDFKLEYKPPGDGPLFRLSQDYPQTKPQPDKGVVALLKERFDKAEHVESYLVAVREYCLAGNELARSDKTFEDGYEDHWNQRTKGAKWFHVPWQHHGEKGREGLHGLTREASAEAGQLAPTQTKKYQTHAVALYNDLGGYTIGQVWKNQFAPNLDVAKFSPGTVVVKVLFTQATEKEVPYLVNPLIWTAYIQDPKSPTDPSKRTVQKLRLLQMDVMIRDDRVRDTGGWIFGTYCYNGELNCKNKWYNLQPVGIQWGNDVDKLKWEHNKDHTQLSPAETKLNSLLKETLLVDLQKKPKLPAQHLGWGGRLNGPADYFRSSCLSCHATAQYPGLEEQHPDFDEKFGFEAGFEPGETGWNNWFRNLKLHEAFGSYEEENLKGAKKSQRKPKEKSYSMDFSLQLQISIENFYEWKGRTMGGYFTFRDDTAPPTSELPTKNEASQEPSP